MKKIQNSAAFVFIACVCVLTVVSILGIWNIFTDDVIAKSFETIGLLAIVSIISIFAAKFTDHEEAVSVVNGESVPVINPAFSVIRHTTVVVLIISAVLLALFGVLAIWEVIGGEAVGKSLASIGLLVFSSLIIIGTCLQREKHKLMTAHVSGWGIFLIIIGTWFVLALLSA